MMTFDQSQLIEELRNLTQDTKSQVQAFKTYSEEQLNHKPSAGGWSVLECIEHLRLYANFYLPEIEKRMTSRVPVESKYFRSGILGNYFVNMVKATNNKKMRTVKEMDTSGTELTISTLNQFIKQLDWLDSLLLDSEKFDLSRIKTSISISRFIKLKLGDTLRFVVYHNERHVLQAKQVLSPQAELANPLFSSD